MSTVFRVFKTEKFSVISNYHLFDKRLTHKATNLLTTMLALSPVWDYTLKGLASLKKDGIDGVRSGIRELEKLGYLTRRQLRNEKGQLAHNEYLVYETPELNPNFAKSEENCQELPSLENPITDKKINSPSLENPSTENPTQLNTKLLNTKYINQSYQDNNNININNTYRCDEMDSIDKIDRKEIKAELKKQLNYENLISRNEADKKQINSIINILADVMSSRSQSIRIGGENKPLEEVIQRFKQLTDKHIAYVLECLNKNADKPRNIRAYLLTSLFNAPSTMDCYYARDADQAETKQYSFDIEEIKALTNSFSGL
ncbi:MAG: helix-turn-helix domain-containing protein [Ruminococcus sp.]|nr:helix-turn-helix domain-containing protein [Ruminococcus sp.]MEE0185841.1 DUF6017 domain-containing protein [Oscillospiraceae bacterium]